ncbi:MAG TPA: DUF2231 domain-containing protein [Pyrinomonadaceae bacterium]|jgi:uncharacterized membrane protein
MATRASIGGHPIHPMLVTFPIGLWVTSFALDIWYYFERNPTWLLASKFMIAAGCLGAIAAAVAGIIDWTGLKDRRVVRIANWHARLNIAALIVFTLSLYFRMQRGGSIVGHRLTIPFLLSFVGVILVCISGWLGGEMAYRHGVGVEVQRDTPEEAQAKERV